MKPTQADWRQLSKQELHGREIAMENKENSLLNWLRGGKLAVVIAVTLAFVAVFCLGVLGVGYNRSGEALAAGGTGTNVAVSGMGEVMVDPDRAYLTVGVVAQGRTANLAQETVAKTQNEIIKLLADYAIPKEKIKTSRYSIYPEYDNNGKINGYRANYDLEVIVDDLDKVGPVIDAVVAAGSNRLNGVRFEKADKTEGYNAALHDAVNDAMQKAEAIAGALGKNVVRVVQIEEQGASVQPIYMDYAMNERAMKSMSDAITIEPGQLQVSARVNIVVEVQ